MVDECKHEYSPSYHFLRDVVRIKIKTLLCKNIRSTFTETRAAHIRHPNQVITKTFSPYHPGPLPSALATTLIDRFNCKDGYRIFPDALSYLKQLSSSPHRQPTSPHRLVVGVITNSDDRVPDVLTSLGLRVSHLRHGPVVTADKVDGKGVQDIDFVIISYDVGVEKPDCGIFAAATDMLDAMLVAEGHEKGYERAEWDLVYIGDEMEKDGRGASEAGWVAVVVDREVVEGVAGEDSMSGVSYKRLVGGKEVDVVSDFTALTNLKARYPMLLG